MATQTSSGEVPKTVTRSTKEGRKLTYQLTVIQQPERARACGSGAKSSADRRPVDPPPVVELRIYDGEPHPNNDITFSYNANFFLFATLESARPIAHGRVQPAAQQVPVLTGMPVSGMAYLDRPSAAGYFIFPDLSVRHEGKYKLSFNLYEETKDSKDADAEQSNENAKPLPMAATPNGSFDWRLEVKSASFTVYSAKKFPGLAESTMLSRTVAEQGCRVRIRRDVRMRRRDGKTSSEFDMYDEEYSRSRRTATPDSIHDAYARQRSLSNSSDDRQPFVSEPRRQSAVGYPQPPYSSNYTPSPVTPQSGHTGYLSFGGGSSSSQYPAPPPTQPTPTQQPYQPLYRQSSTSGNYNYPERQPYPSRYPTQREGIDSEHRRPSVSYSSAPLPPGSKTATTDQDCKRLSYQGYPPRPHSPVSQQLNLAPIKMSALEPKLESLSSSAGTLSATRMAPALPSPSYHDRPSAYSQYTVPALSPAVPEASRNGKRPFDAVFSTPGFTQPLHNGMRPSSSHQMQGSTSTPEDDDDSVSIEALRMQYKRADGTSYSRELPPLD